jgi:hypothetical protein
MTRATRSTVLGRIGFRIFGFIELFLLMVLLRGFSIIDEKSPKPSFR